MNKEWDVIIIGGGSSGMFAGVFSSLKGKKVLILEKNKQLGEKLKITGGGRCNITNNEPDIHKFLEIYGDKAQYLYSPFSKFSVKDTFKFFESRGLPLITQARNRVFPKTEKANDVYDLLKRELENNKVKIISNCTVKNIILNKNKKIERIETSQGNFYSKSFILSTGGLSHPKTGSTGDGFNWLRNMGHSVKDPSPNIVPLEVSNTWIKKLAGTSLSFMKISFYLDNKKIFSKKGKILFTHFGLSGPLILNSSKKVSELLQSGKVTALIDVFPDTNHGKLEQDIINYFDKNKNKNLSTVLKDFMPEGFYKAFENIDDRINFSSKIHSIKKEERKLIVDLLKAMPVNITNLMGYDRAVVADGGVNIDEINLKTMSSKLIENLYITGDLLDINRNSGGYSLQLCWTTGYIAGTNA